MIKACIMCNNAKIDEDLTDDTDYSACIVATDNNKFRTVICSGAGKSLHIDMEKWDDKAGWYVICSYYPKFCPECGREIIEYKRPPKAV